MRMEKSGALGNAKCWQGYGATETLIYCQWKCEIVAIL